MEHKVHLQVAYGECVVTVDGRALGPDEYSVDRKAGTVKLLQAAAGTASVIFYYLSPTQAPRKEAQWKRGRRSLPTKFRPPLSAGLDRPAGRLVEN